MNVKNNKAKKNLYLAYSKENKAVYPLTIKAMARYMSTQYPNKNSGHQQTDKKGDINRKKRDDLKSEDNDNNTTGFSGAHVGDATTPEDSTASSGEASTGAHVLEVNL